MGEQVVQEQLAAAAFNGSIRIIHGGTGSARTTIHGDNLNNRGDYTWGNR